ncbi:MAG: 2Fe-2S iron-sulfur cluster-binding protein, partial [Candidatus Ranarchaeia archaeon]
MVDLRIKKHPILTFDRGEPVDLKYDGRTVQGYTNETIASALFASGYDIYSRSLKY